MKQPLTIVLAGCGGMSGTWLKVAQSSPEVRVVGLVDLRPENARTRAQENGLDQVLIGTDLKTVLDRTHPDIVFDCTIPAAHCPVTLEALKHGCHVLGEKPMADSIENARKMVETARQAGKLYAVTQNYRYNPNIRRVREFITAPTGIGPLTTINADFFIGAHFGGFRDLMDHVLLLDMAIHTFDAARFMTGADPVRVYCHEWNPRDSWYAHGASAAAIFEMSNGIVFNYRGSWCAEGLMTGWNSQWRIIGRNGTLKWDGTEQIQAQTVLKREGFNSTFEDRVVPGYENPAKTASHESIIREFFDCVQNNRIPETVCTDNIKSLAMVFGAIESAETGKPVTIKL